jgi:urea transport system permease protein
MIRCFLAGLLVLLTGWSASAQDGPMQTILMEQSDLIVESSRRTIEPAIDAVAGSGLPQAQDVLQAWQGREMGRRTSDGRFFRVEAAGGGVFRLTDFDTGEAAGEATSADIEEIRPNSGIRALLATALVRFQLSDPDPAMRQAALDSIQRDRNADALEPLRESIDTEDDPALKAQKRRLERLLTAAFDDDEAFRVAAIESLSDDLGVDARATLTPLVQTRVRIYQGEPPATANVARWLEPGTPELSREAAYDLLVADGLAAPRVSPGQVLETLNAGIEDGRVGGVAVETLGTEAARAGAYAALVAAGRAEAAPSADEIAAAIDAHRFAEVYGEPSAAVTAAAVAALDSIEFKVGVNQAADLALDALSLASIYFLAAIGLAITFGVMGVINMAHGEFIMMGAYTGYVVQLFIPDHTLSVLLAIPAAFAVTFLAGVVMERLVIRRLANRPLETLLATFGIAIALQQLAKNIFGTQARPLTAPEWLGGAWVINDVVSVSTIRIAIFFLALLFLALFLFIMRRTRLGLETRAVTQNPRMAASMGINVNRVNMLTFGLGSGIAGIAGVAIGLFAKVTSELGGDYIVQSFMTVVVGGVGSIWGTLLGAVMIGFLQKGIEWANPSNTLAAQTYMIIFIILFLQFRPRGIIALKGRAAGD